MADTVGGWAAFIIEKCAMPAALALGGWLIAGALDRQKLQLEQEKSDQVILARAMTVLFDKGSEERLWGGEVGAEERRVFRSHWIATYNRYARVRLEQSEIAVLMEAGLRSDGPVVTLAARPDAIAPGPVAGPPQAGPTPSPVVPRGDGWVSVGRPGGPRYADVNFDLVGNAAFNPDGTLPAGTLMLARWSVNLRDSTDVTTAGGNKVRGILGASQCVKVIESRANIRGATWAFITLDGCERSG